ncbi:DNA-methyltransferase [Mycobacteroides abscessus]|uniref:DNA-methyltransferase n=1 Tax=Mycobacteroides abscessus TaxID=36809 RepID=UPI00092A89A4|nr:site-specific DNA-methyltransferase [Mycobacteroides abscessus]SIE19039.1 DNA adenine methyltransferase YhdJ [Mycobacteroides abscessus subsp. abscessus]
MITPYYQDDSVTLHHGDCLDVLRADDYGYDWNLGYSSARMFPDNSVDAVITDPPYELAFMGRAWDTSGIAFNPAVWAQCLRILKPGGHLLAFGGSRTWHRLAAAIEDAGFEIRDSIAWLYGSGFPKSLDVSKAIDKAAGAEREVVGTHHRHGGGSAVSGSMLGSLGTDSELPLTAPATVAAKRWQGWGTALKPSFEPIVVARKPLAGTVAANVLEYGTGALNIDACRIPTGDKLGGGSTTRGQQMKDGWHRPWMDDPDMVAANAERSRASVARSEELGRWPTNVVLDKHQAEVLDRQSGTSTSRVGKPRGAASGAGWGMTATGAEYADEGGASRFFPVFRYEAKAPTSERPNADGVQHPTVKPLDLMRWLVRLVTPVGAVVLEPFAGSGTTAEACILEDRRCIAIEREAEYLPLIVSRLRKPVQQGLFGLGAGA